MRTDWTLTDMAERGASETFATWPTARRVEVARNVLHAAGVPALVAEVERLREALGSCGGFLVTLRDTCDYDFTIEHEKQIGRLCQEIFHAIHPQEPSE